MSRPHIYLAGPIGGLTWDEASKWRDSVTTLLSPMECRSPLRPLNGVDLRDSCFVTDSARLSNESVDTSKKLLPFGKLFDRDYADCHECDGVFVNFIGAKKQSVGTICEIAWAFRRGVPLVVVIDKDNINHNPFLNPQYTKMFDNLADGVNYMRGAFGYTPYDANGAD